MSLITPQETEQYLKNKLSESDMSESPFIQFRDWFEDAKKAGISLPEAMSLATAELPSGRVSDRVVLLKELDANGEFVVYSNWEHSRKASDLKSNPNVALSFWWKEIERCVRIEGKARRMTTEESQVYFSTRPRGSQIGAWVSRQSQPLTSRDELEADYAKVEEKYKDKETIDCPPFWGGIKVTPERIEFWQGRNSRVHDRFEYTKNSQDTWDIARLNP